MDAAPGGFSTSPKKYLRIFFKILRINSGWYTLKKTSWISKHSLRIPSKFPENLQSRNVKKSQGSQWYSAGIGCLGGLKKYNPPCTCFYQQPCASTGQSKKFPWWRARHMRVHTMTTWDPAMCFYGLFLRAPDGRDGYLQVQWKPGNNEHLGSGLFNLFNLLSSLSLPLLLRTSTWMITFEPCENNLNSMFGIFDYFLGHDNPRPFWWVLPWIAHCPCLYQAPPSPLSPLLHHQGILGQSGLFCRTWSNVPFRDMFISDG